MTEIAHDVAAAIVLIVGAWAGWSVWRDERRRMQRAQRIYRGWCRRG